MRSHLLFAAFAYTSAQQSWWWAGDPFGQWLAPDLNDTSAIVSIPYDKVTSEEVRTKFAGRIILHAQSRLCLGAGCNSKYMNGAPPAPPSSTVAPTGTPDVQMTLNFPPPTPDTVALKDAILQTVITANPNTGLTLSSISLTVDMLGSTVSVTFSGQTLDTSAILTMLIDASFLTGVSNIMNAGSYTVAVPAYTSMVQGSSSSCPAIVGGYDPQTDNVWWSDAVDGNWSDATMWSGGRPEDAVKVQNTTHTIHTYTHKPHTRIHTPQVHMRARI